MSESEIAPAPETSDPEWDRESADFNKWAQNRLTEENIPESEWAATQEHYLKHAEGAKHWGDFRAALERGLADYKAARIPEKDWSTASDGEVNQKLSQMRMRDVRQQDWRTAAEKDADKADKEARQQKNWSKATDEEVDAEMKRIKEKRIDRGINTFQRRDGVA